jgi:short-subunit dehydrogenase
MKVNYEGTHNMSHTFWDSLSKKPESTIVNMLSVASFTLIPQLATYCASKAAAHTLTRSLRAESEGTSIRIFGIYPGYVDTKMTQNIVDVEKVTPELIAKETCDGIENGTLDVFPDKMAKAFSWRINGDGINASETRASLFTPLENPKTAEQLATEKLADNILRSQL